MNIKFGGRIKKLSFHKLFANNRFLIFFSLVLSIIFWFSISMTVSNEVTRTVSSVPVTIDLNSYGISTWNLTIFGEKEFTVDVEITGENYRVRQVTADDIVVTAQTSLVESEGKNTLLLSYKLADGVTGFSITNVSPAYIDVYFDVSTTQYFTVEPKVIASQIAGEDCEIGDYSLSTTMIKVTGPKTEINKIKKVNAIVEITEPITQTSTFDCVIQAVDDSGNEPKYLEYEEAEKIQLTIPILKRKEIPVSVDFINVPKTYLEFPLEYTLDHNSLIVTAPASSIDSLEVIELGEIDFNKLSPTENTFRFLFDLPAGFNVVDDTATVSVKVNMDGMELKNFSIPKNNISVVNLPMNTKIDILSDGISTVNIVGPQSVISKLSDSDIYAKIELDNEILSNNAEQIVKVVVYVKNDDDCWAYGTYSVKIRVDRE